MRRYRPKVVETFSPEERLRIEAKKAAQKTFWEQSGTPHFAPENGVCDYCERQIYQDLGVSLNDAKKLVTGCPLCHRSFCD